MQAMKKKKILTRWQIQLVSRSSFVRCSCFSSDNIHNVSVASLTVFSNIGHVSRVPGSYSRCLTLYPHLFSLLATSSDLTVSVYLGRLPLTNCASSHLCCLVCACALRSTCLWSAELRQRLETLFLMMRSPQTFLVVMTHYHESPHSLHEMHVSYTSQCVSALSHTSLPRSVIML